MSTKPTEIDEQIEEQEELSDEEVAEIASKEISKRDKKIKELEKQVAISKMYSTPEEEQNPVTMEDCLKTLNNENSCNYDYAEAIVNAIDIEASKGVENPFGDEGLKVRDFLKDVIDTCDGDKSKFVSVYQSKIGADDKNVAAAYNAKYGKFMN